MDYSFPGLLPAFRFLDPRAAYRGTYNPQGEYVPLEEGGRAQDMAAQILASEFADWEQTYKPVELNLLGQSSLNNPNVLPNAVAQATADTDTAFNATEGVQQRKLAAQGIAVTPEQQATSSRIRSLSRAAAVAGAQNQARQAVAAHDELIALGTVPNPQMVQG